MGLENLIPEGDGLRLMTVGLDGEAADRVRQAAVQAKAGMVTAFPDYSETLLNGQSVSSAKRRRGPDLSDRFRQGQETWRCKRPAECSASPPAPLR